MQPITTFNTPRLNATCFAPDDYPTLCQLHQDPKVMATLGGVRSHERTKKFLEERIAHFALHGFGYYMFRQRDTNEFVGRAGLQHLHIDGRDEVELGYTVCAEMWGQSYATEMAQGMLDLGFAQLGLDNLVCFTLTTNLASKRVMEKVGFNFEKQIDHGGSAHLFYRLVRTQFLSLSNTPSHNPSENR